MTAPIVKYQFNISSVGLKFKLGSQFPLSSHLSILYGHLVGQRQLYLTMKAMLGAQETYSGHLEQAVENYERALRLSPHDPMRFSYYFGIGAARYGLGEYADALPMLEQGYIEAPGSTWAPRLIMACAAELGMTRRMEETAAIVRALKPQSSAEELVDSAPIRDQGYRDRLTASFKKAGF